VQWIGSRFKTNLLRKLSVGRPQRNLLGPGRSAERRSYLFVREITVTETSICDRADCRAVNRNHIKSRNQIASLAASRHARRFARHRPFLPFAREGFYINELVDVRNWRKERNCRVRSSETTGDDGIIEKVLGNRARLIWFNILSVVTHCPDSSNYNQTRDYNTIGIFKCI